MNTDPGLELSRDGIARKDAIFKALISAQRRRTVRARAGRVGAVALVLGVAGVTSWTVLHGGVTGWTGRLTQSGSTGSPPVVGPPPQVEPAGVRVQIVTDDPTVTARLTATGDPGRVTIIDDDELDGYLARAGQTPGNVRTAGRFILASDIPPPRPGSS